MSKRLTLILGGARSGKSRYAEQLAQSGGRVLYVATAEAGDEEMAARIEAHRRNRPEEWDTLEEPLHLVDAISPLRPEYDTILLDCLTLWTSNLMHRESTEGTAEVDIPAEAQRLLDCYAQGEESWIVVSNEVGLSLVPRTALGRRFRDELGRLNQIVASAADEVLFMAAGLPLNLKTTRDG